MIKPNLKKNVMVLMMMTVLVVMTGSCAKEEQAPEIPYVYVNFSLNPNGTQYIRLNVVNGWEYVYGGYRGILIFRSGINEFKAFERACPNDPQVEGAEIKVDTAGTTCYCPVCKSKYIMTDGSPYDGPSHYPLRQYSTMYDGMILYVSN